MGKINVLSFAVANLIAAGEVVDRPASAVKELMENSIDAGADHITVEIQNGGVTYMRVSDNGCGMTPEDLPMAIRRHATSKIREEEDLEKIITLGFRGEALAAISAVADVRILSKTADAEMGAMLEVSCGDILGVSERGCSKGTTVIVENLFENVPARRKFLKRDVTEAMAVTANVEKVALSHPEVAVRLICDGQVKLETGGDGKLQNAIYSVFGRDFAKRLIPVDSDTDGIRVTGFIGCPDNVKGNRNYQNFFLNGRFIKSRTAGAALEQAYISYCPTEKFPVCVLNMVLNPARVDVNVHPSKLEVKFSNEKAVFEAIYYTVRAALETNRSRPDFQLSGNANKAGGAALSLRSPYVKVSEMKMPVEEAIRGESAQKRQLTMENLGAGRANATPEAGFVHMTAEEYAKKYTHADPKTKASWQEPLDARNTDGSLVANREALLRTAEDNKAPDAAKLYGAKAPAVEADQAEARATGEPDEKARPAMPHAPEETQGLTDRIEEPPGRSLSDPTESQRASSEPPTAATIPDYRIVGELFHCYVVVELMDKVLLVDKHAAHERINFEKLKAGMYAGEHPSQLLLLPIDVMLTSQEVQTIELYREEIEALGFSFSTARNTVSVTAVPVGVDSEAVNDMITAMADRLTNGTGQADITRNILFEKALYQAACKASIKGGKEYPPEYVAWLIARLMELPDITVCPHGRPVAMVLSKKNIERQFGRE